MGIVSPAEATHVGLPQALFTLDSREGVLKDELAFAWPPSVLLLSSFLERGCYN